MTSATGSPGGFVVTKSKVLIVVSLAITWFVAGLIPQYKPAIQSHFKSRLDEARQKIPSVTIDWHPTANPNQDPRNNFNRAKVALLIEPRPLPHLVPQILHMISVAPPDWRFVFIGSNKSVHSVGTSYATKHQQAIGKLDLMVLPRPWEIDEKEKVYRLLTDVRFYDEFLPGVEWLLKYEYDSILCANSDQSLNDWLHWDWAGAPRTENDRFSGNGGLSLRKVSTIKRVLSFQSRLNDSQPEDEWFGFRVWALPGAKVASGSTGQLAVEDTYIKNPMGYHVREGGANLADAVWKSPEQRKEMFQYCPELSVIMDMKLERERCEGDNREGKLPDSADDADDAPDADDEASPSG